jgi:TrmH family RNA methyltransferase
MITSRQNQRLKDMRGVRRCKDDRALLEGPHLVAEAAAAGCELDTVLATPAFLASEEGRALAATLPRPPLAVEPRLLDVLADADSPRGVIAAARLPRRGAGSLPLRPAGVYVYADGLQDPGNLGALARVAEAAGAAGLALAPGSAHPNHPRALRASAGSLLRLPVAVDAVAEAIDAHLSGAAGAGGAPPRWIALAPRGGADLYAGAASWSADGVLVLALGAEGPGLSAAVAGRATLALTIPMAPPVESLNAVVAAALVLFEIGRRRSSPR